MTLTIRTECDSVITRYIHFNTSSKPGNRAVLSGDEINKQKPSRSGPSKVEVSGNSMCVVSRKPSVRLLLALAPHLAQPSALPLLPAPRLAHCSTALLPGGSRPAWTHLGRGRAWSLKHVNASCQKCSEHAYFIHSWFRRDRKRATNKTSSVQNTLKEFEETIV